MAQAYGAFDEAGRNGGGRTYSSFAAKQFADRFMHVDERFTAGTKIRCAIVVTFGLGIMLKELDRSSNSAENREAAMSSGALPRTADPATAKTAGAARSPAAPVGTWGWFNPNGSGVQINPDGTAVHLSNGGQVDTGSWKLLQPSLTSRRKINRR